MKKILTSILIFILAISLVACNSGSNKQDLDKDNPIVDDSNKPAPEDDENEDIEDENTEDEDKEEATIKSQVVNLYFVNSEYVETGDEDLEKLISKEISIEYKDMILEEAIVRNLMEEQMDDNLSTLIPESVELIDVKVQDNAAFVNFAQEGMNGGSMEERFTIEQIVESLLELDNIEEVQFLIDGEKSESLMGHIEIMEPFK